MYSGYGGLAVDVVDNQWYRCFVRAEDVVSGVASGMPEDDDFTHIKVLLAILHGSNFAPVKTLLI